MCHPDSLTILVIAAACALSDVLTGKIPNSLILCGLSCAGMSRVVRSICIVLNALLQGSEAHALQGLQQLRWLQWLRRLQWTQWLQNAQRMQGIQSMQDMQGVQGLRAVLAILADGAGGLVLPFLLLGVLAALKMMGGGDVKLLSVIGLQFGLRASLQIIWYSLLASAVCSVILIVRRGCLAARMHYFYAYLAAVMRAGHALPYRPPEGGGGDSSGEFCMAVPICAALIIYLMTRF